MGLYLFFIKEGFYPLELKNDDEAITNALNNPPVYKVESIDGKNIPEVSSLRI